MYGPMMILQRDVISGRPRSDTCIRRSIFPTGSLPSHGQLSPRPTSRTRTSTTRLIRVTRPEASVRIHFADAAVEAWKELRVPGLRGRAADNRRC